MIFLTYNDNFSGIYKSQVTDVCSFLQKEFAVKIKLVALVSIRSYATQKQLIKLGYPNSVVLPMFPKVRFWKLNTITLFLICLFSGKRKVWARGPFACNMAVYLKKSKLITQVVFDARGAYQAELTEYSVVEDRSVKNNIDKIENNALVKSEAQLSVSNKLVEWWKIKYNYSSTKFVVIPCTLSSLFYRDLCSEEELLMARKKGGFAAEDIVLIYSGSSAGWQSFSMVDDFLYELFSDNTNIKLIFLSNEIPAASKTFQKYADRITTKWLKPNEVFDLMILADYGILIREPSVTNQVASPVKFAEYLACGLQVLISEGIGDFTEFVKEHQCGLLLSKKMKIEKVSFAQKVKNHKLAMQYFLKEADVNKNAYKKLLHAIN
ncbi:MAG: glycosyltransferase family protein [Bacteroidia bacterium]